FKQPGTFLRVGRVWELGAFFATSATWVSRVYLVRHRVVARRKKKEEWAKVRVNMGERKRKRGAAARVQQERGDELGFWLKRDGATINEEADEEDIGNA
ncbi:hypothetical protein U1Q18_025468, partial [Sarracenia purpurea var. burkii]